MSTALATKEPTVTAEQLELVRKTVANGATADELKLYLYDCARQGVHPLDKLLHFTKRGGRYTPVTSIDLMRIRAAETGEYAGSDDAVFEETINNAINHATVTVWRLVAGQRCAFTATARWSEYYPGDAAGSMWKKMPHTMLAKCAEALALRKGFPRQLAGLYAREEMDQAGGTGYAVEAPTVTPAPIPVHGEGRENPAAATGEIRGVTQHGEEIPADGKLYVSRVELKPTKNQNVTKALVHFSDGSSASTIKSQLTALAEQLCQDREPVVYEYEDSRWGRNLTALMRDAEIVMQVHGSDPDSQPLTDDDIPF